MIASRVDDGRNDTSIVYTRTPAAGVWQPPATGMALAWLGFVDPVIAVEPVALNGPDALTSAGYAKDYDEVRRLGSATSTERTPRQTAIAQFFAPNAVVTYRDALCRHLDESRSAWRRPRACSPASTSRSRRPSSPPGGSSSTSASGDPSRPSPVRRRTTTRTPRRRTGGSRSSPPRPTPTTRPGTPRPPPRSPRWCDGPSATTSRCSCGRSPTPPPVSWSSGATRR